jgi:hypothetical protein
VSQPITAHHGTEVTNAAVACFGTDGMGGGNGAITKADGFITSDRSISFDRSIITDDCLVHAMGA